MLKAHEIINRLKPCTYKYNEIKDLGDKINFGFLAQDILEEFGEGYNFVKKDQNNEFYQVNYYQFIAPLVTVLKEQRQEIELLKSEIQKLKDKMC